MYPSLFFCFVLKSPAVNRSSALTATSLDIYNRGTTQSDRRDPKYTAMSGDKALKLALST